MSYLELLSPAGDLDIFKSVVNAGADAVYFGGDMFGARAYAKNFSAEDASEAIKYGHLHGAKSYLTVNTLLKNLEIEKNLYDYLKHYVECGVDAFIVQDFGVMDFIKTYFPDTPIHASTQLSLCTSYGAGLLSDFGASRIVTARELSLKEIADIHRSKPDLEIESFIHGALCVCYSGQCLMSSLIGGRSGNRGRCAQPCRLPYKAYDASGSQLPLSGDYVLSPKDFCTINYLPDMIEAGVMSFKIEGRMKQISYATGVVSVYRHYLDEYIEKGREGFSVFQKDIEKLLDFGNRSGFTDLYLHHHNGPEMMTFQEPSHSKAKDEKIIAQEEKIMLDAKVTANLGKPLEITFTDEKNNSFKAVGPEVSKALKKSCTIEDIKSSVSALGNTSFEIKSCDISLDDEVFLPVSHLKSTRRLAVEGLENILINQRKYRILPFTTIKNSENINTTDVNSVFVTVENLEQFKVVLGYDFVKKIAIPFDIFDEAKVVNNRCCELFVTLPLLLRLDYASTIEIPTDCAGVLAASFDEVGFLLSKGIDREKIILDHRLYTFSNRAINGFKNRLGIDYNCLPVELSLKEIAHRDNSSSQMIIYSRLPLMITANCSIKNSKGCNKRNEQYSLVDRKNISFPAKANCKYCYNTIYNSKKYMAFGLKDQLEKLCVFEYRMDFSIESTKEIVEVLDSYKSIFIENKEPVISIDHTNGHLKRGVE